LVIKEGSVLLMHGVTMKFKPYKHVTKCEISGFCCGVVEAFTFVSCYTM